MSSIAVIGAGAWGIALAIQAARAGNRVTLWARDPEAARARARLPGPPLPDAVHVTGDLPRAEIALIAVPTAYLRVAVAGLRAETLVACCKGLVDSRLPLELLAATHPGIALAVLTGPNFAHEIAAGLPAASVVASADAGTRAAVIAALGTAAFRLYGNDDPVGAQVCGAAKNVVAIAAGAIVGAGLGENARAALVTRGLAELGRLCAALGGRAETAAGLSGLGDLMLTCAGAGSRNFSFGVALGRGERAADILAARDTATEGVAAAPALLARAPDTDLPICRAVAALLSGEANVAQAMATLLSRPLRNE